MHDRTPEPDDLEPIERASIDELRGLQLERLQWSLRHAYDNVPHYRKAFDAKGVHPDDCKSLEDLALFPFTAKADLRDNYPFGMFAVPQAQVSRIHASSGTTGPSHRRRLHRRRHPHMVDGHGPLDPRQRRATGRQGARRVRVRPVHRRSRCALRRRSARLHGHPDLRRHDRTPGHADPRLRARRHHGHAVVHVGHRRRDGTAGRRSAHDQPAGRHLRRRTVDERHAPRDGTASRHARRRHLRAVRGDGPRRRQRMRRDEGRPAHLGGPLLSRGHRPGRPATCCPTVPRASWSSRA